MRRRGRRRDHLLDDLQKTWGYCNFKKGNTRS